MSVLTTHPLSGVRLVLAAAALTLGLTGCGSIIEEPPPTVTGAAQAGTLAATGPIDLNLADFTSSAMTETGSDVNAAARNAVGQKIASAAPGSTIKVVGFTNRPGQECDPLVLSFPVQDNPESEAQLRIDATERLPTLWAAYGECLRSAETGLATGGSGIFGATVLAATTQTTGVVSLTVYTDGCTWHELAPAPETCTGAVLDAPTGPETLVASMPSALKPPIALPVSFVLVGRGTDLVGTRLLALNRVFQLWGQATGSSVTVVN